MKATAERKNWHVANLKMVTDALYELGARSLASVKGPSGGTLDFYARNGKVVIVQAYSNESGLEVWCPVTDKMKMTDVVEAMRQHLIEPSTEPERTPSLASEVGA